MGKVSVEKGADFNANIEKFCVFKIILIFNSE